MISNSLFQAHPDNNYLHKRVSLVKRPPLVRSSSPKIETTKCKKSVRFRESLENVRLFLKTQMPKACKADPTCQPKYTYQLHKLNWPTHLHQHCVQLERVDLLHQEPCLFLVGTLSVANLAFEKQVEIRYTYDNWMTQRSLYAAYKEANGTSDRFQFRLELEEDTTELQLAVRYKVSNHEYWDNNQDKNYKFKIVPDIEFDDSSSSDEDDIKSPPLSPTTPVDENPLYQHYYFQQNNNLNSFIHNYCFYNPLYDLSQKVIHSA